MKKTFIPTHDFAPENDLGAVAVRCIPLEIRNSYDFSEPHRHAYFEVFFFGKGGGTHLIDFIAHPIADRSVHIVRPGQVHLLQRAPGSHGAVVHFPVESLLHLGRTATDLLHSAYSVLRFEELPFESLCQLLSVLQHEIQNTTLPAEIATAYLHLLLVKVHHDALEKELASEVNTHFEAFRQLAETHYREGENPSWYATQLCITEKKLNEFCKAATGNTVGAYLKARVLLEAKRLLSFSERSVKEIGYHLGFEDPAYFTRFFRKAAGCTAGDFRKKYQ